MRPSYTPIFPAAEPDFARIEELARSFDLDWEDASWQQFVVAKKNDVIIGFGRLRRYAECYEIATVGVIPAERTKGVGSAIVRYLAGLGPREVFVTCVIPDFFSKLGFQKIKQYPAVLQKKVDFCKAYNFTDDQIFVMRLVKGQ